MLDQDDGDAEIGDAPDQLAERGLVGAHEPRCGLIQQQDLRTDRKRPRDLDQPAVDMRQVSGQRRQRPVIADEGEQSFGGAPVIGRGDIAERVA